MHSPVLLRYIERKTGIPTTRRTTTAPLTPLPTPSCFLTTTLYQCCASQTRQWSSLELIASENFTSRAVMDCLGSALTNKVRYWLHACFALVFSPSIHLFYIECALFFRSCFCCQLNAHVLRRLLLEAFFATPSHVRESVALPQAAAATAAAVFCSTRRGSREHDTTAVTRWWTRSRASASPALSRRTAWTPRSGELTCSLTGTHKSSARDKL